MKMLKKLFASKETRAALGVLEEARYIFNSEAFTEIKMQVEKHLLKNQDSFIKTVQDGVSPRLCVYNAITKIAGEMLGSGQFHIYRGVLSMHGNELHQIFVKAVDEIVKTGALDENGRRRAMSDISEAIKCVG